MKILLTLCFLGFAAVKADDKCGLGGKPDDGYGPVFNTFSDPAGFERTSRLFTRRFVLVNVADPDDVCRHRLAATLKCELAEATLQWGQMSGYGGRRFPYQMWLGDPSQSLLIQANGPEDHAPNGGWTLEELQNVVDYNKGAVKLEVKAAGREQDILQIHNHDSACDFKFNYHLNHENDDQPKLDFRYTRNGVPANGTGMCYRQSLP